jgi:hypothetical protein
VLRGRVGGLTKGPVRNGLKMGVLRQTPRLYEYVCSLDIFQKSLNILQTFWQVAVFE